MPKKIGIVEDEGIVALDISGIVRNLGYETAFIADSGEKTLILVKETKPDVLLMDIELKGQLNGLQTANHIKQEMDIPVIFLTAFEDENTISRIREVSTDGYLVKPFEDESLRIILEKVLN
jgi:CheY-like chemotaxis protein